MLEFLNLTQVVTLSLSGSIPSELGLLTMLKDLILSVNGNLRGSIPFELGQLTSLQSLTLGYTGVSGEIPSELGLLTNLRYVSLSCTYVSGIVPETLCESGAIVLINCYHVTTCTCCFCDEGRYLGGKSECTQ